MPKTMVAIGKYGQYIFVAKNTNTVIVITSADSPRGLRKTPLLMELFRAAAESWYSVFIQQKITMLNLITPVVR